MYLRKNLVMILDGFFTSKHFLASRRPIAVTSAATDFTWLDFRLEGSALTKGRRNDTHTDSNWLVVVAPERGCVGADAHE
jgi:hypothetical protein